MVRESVSPDDVKSIAGDQNSHVKLGCQTVIVRSSVSVTLGFRFSFDTARSKVTRAAVGSSPFTPALLP
jgi:hypothetical protein